MKKEAYKLYFNIRCVGVRTNLLGKLKVVEGDYFWSCRSKYFICDSDKLFNEIIAIRQQIEDEFKEILKAEEGNKIELSIPDTALCSTYCTKVTHFNIVNMSVHKLSFKETLEHFSMSDILENFSISIKNA